MIELLRFDMALPWHRDQAMKVARAMLDEGAFRGIAVSEAKIMRTLAAGKDSVFSAFGTDDGIVAGAVVGGLVPHWFSDAVMGMEFIHFVYPDFRGTDVAGVLLDAFERWAYVHGAAGIYVEQMSGIEPARAEAFYSKRGYRRVGVLMEKGVSRVQP